MPTTVELAQRYAAALEALLADPDEEKQVEMEDADLAWHHHALDLAEQNQDAPARSRGEGAVEPRV